MELACLQLIWSDQRCKINDFRGTGYLILKILSGTFDLSSFFDYIYLKKAMNITVSGASGFTGSYLSKYLLKKGHTVNVINRDSFRMSMDEFVSKKINGMDAVINLAGSPVIARWNDASKKEMVESRVETTRMIVDAIGLAQSRPPVFINASATGIYDSIHEHDEESPNLAHGFLADLVRSWEAEAARAAGFTRTVILRTGLVLGGGGGALKKMFLPFSIGLGGKIGSGKQYMSWIYLEDLAAIYLMAIDNSSFSGIYNAVAPNPVTNRYFTDIFGKVLNQPTLLTVPEFALKAVYGEGSRTLTEGQNVKPARLLREGFIFRYPTIEKALVKIYK